MAELGVRLPEDLYLKIHNVKRRVLHTRTCVACGNKWPTTEIALLQKWKGRDFDKCQDHNIKSKAITHIGITQARKGKMYSFGLHKVMDLGGYYRRRECQAKVAIDEEGLELKKCGARWTTGEFLSEGIVCEDVQMCAKCGSVQSKIERGKWKRRKK